MNKCRCLQINLSSMGIVGKRYCMSRKMTPGKMIMPRRPPVTGPITSFVAWTGSGWVQPLAVICQRHRLDWNEI